MSENRKKSGKKQVKRRFSTSAGSNIPRTKKIQAKRKSKKPVKRDSKGRIIKGSGPLEGSGRPSNDVNITALIKEILNEPVAKKGTNTYARQVAKAIVIGAIGLDRTAVKELLNRVDGPVEKKLTVEDTVKNVLEFVVAPRPKKRSKAQSRKDEK